MSLYSPEYLCNRCGVFPCKCGFEKDPACPNCDRLKRENERLRFALEEITTTEDDETETYNVAEIMRRRAIEALQELDADTVSKAVRSFGCIPADTRFLLARCLYS